MMGLQVLGLQVGGGQEACLVLQLQAVRCWVQVGLTLIDLVQLTPRADLVELRDDGIWLVLLHGYHGGTSRYLGATGASHGAVARRRSLLSYWLFLA